MRLLATLSTLLLLYACNFKHQEADVIFHNAVIVDCDGVGQEKAEAKAIAVKDGPHCRCWSGALYKECI